jgi:hypothetical protein
MMIKVDWWVLIEIACHEEEGDDYDDGVVSRRGK